MSKSSEQLMLPMLLVGICTFASGPANAADKFKVTSVDCEMFWLWKHTPVIHYDIIDEHKVDYQRNPAGEYFAAAAERTAAYCDRTSDQKQQPLGPPRKIRGVWFQSNDDSVKILYSFDQNGVDASAGLVNRIGDKYAVDQRAAAQHEAQVEEIRTREARAQEVKAAQLKAEQDRVAAEAAREQTFYAEADLQRLRLGTTVTPANFAFVQDVRTNPFHYRKLGVAVVRTQFNKMITDNVALFGNELAPILIHIEDVDRFTKNGETVMLAFKVTERGEVERSNGNLPEIIISAMKQEPLFGDYVGAYTCPGDDCNHIYDVPPRT